MHDIWVDRILKYNEKYILFGLRICRLYYTHTHTYTFIYYWMSIHICIYYIWHAVVLIFDLLQFWRHRHVLLYFLYRLYTYITILVYACDMHVYYSIQYHADACGRFNIYIYTGLFVGHAHFHLYFE